MAWSTLILLYKFLYQKKKVNVIEQKVQIIDQTNASYRPNKYKSSTKQTQVIDPTNTSHRKKRDIISFVHFINNFIFFFSILCDLLRAHFIKNLGSYHSIYSYNRSRMVKTLTKKNASNRPKKCKSSTKKNN